MTFQICGKWKLKVTSPIWSRIIIQSFWPFPFQKWKWKWTYRTLFVCLFAIISNLFPDCPKKSYGPRFGNAVLFCNIFWWGNLNHRRRWDAKRDRQPAIRLETIRSRLDTESHLPYRGFIGAVLEIMQIWQSKWSPSVYVYLKIQTLERPKAP